MNDDKKHYHELLAKIAHHDMLYYQKSSPEISDYDYDMLVNQLKDIEKRHPEWVSATSPSQVLADKPTKGFVQKKHDVPMLSLGNTYTTEEIGAFMDRVYKTLEKKNIKFFTELKMDGIAISVKYEHGKLVQALTRGDGVFGDDVTENIKTIKSLPHELKGQFPQSLELRGEVFMPHSVFNKLNADKQELGEPLYANPRNAASGSLKMLDPNEVKKRHLDIVFYGIAQARGLKLINQHELNHLLKQWGLPSQADEHVALTENLDEITQYASRIEHLRSKLPFDIDGIVIKVDHIPYHELLGFTAKTPRFAIAYKFAPQVARTKLLDITLQVGRTGIITPVAELEPTFLAGSTIARATLHNADEIKRKDIRVGDYVFIEKGGDVIPKVTGVDLKSRDPHSKVFHMPSHCPCCNAVLEKHPDDVGVYCTNFHGCDEQIVRFLQFFVSKNGLDIEHLGEKVVRALYEHGFVKEPADFFKLSEKQLGLLEGFKEKSISNVMQALALSKTVTLDKFLVALGIPSVGAGLAKELAKKYKNLDELRHATIEDLTSIEGIGEKSAKAICHFFKDHTKSKMVDHLIATGMMIENQKQELIEGHQFFGKKFVLTGTLEGFSRDEAKALIEQRGGKVATSVSKQTDFVLYGQEAGSKLEKAISLKVPLMDEAKFKSLL